MSATAIGKLIDSLALQEMEAASHFTLDHSHLHLPRSSLISPFHQPYSLGSRHP